MITITVERKNVFWLAQNEVGYYYYIVIHSPAPNTTSMLTRSNMHALYTHSEPTICIYNPIYSNNLRSRRAKLYRI